MSMKKIAIFTGLFSLVVGWLTYDSEVATAPMPIIAGLIVIVLAVFGLIPEFVSCPSCGRKNLKSRKECAHCRAALTTPDDKPADQ
jgi:recombinational DNA repair protein (RecF pathway)